MPTVLGASPRLGAVERRARQTSRRAQTSEHSRVASLEPRVRIRVRMRMHMRVHTRMSKYEASATLVVSMATSVQSLLSTRQRRRLLESAPLAANLCHYRGPSSRAAQLGISSDSSRTRQLSVISAPLRSSHSNWKPAANPRTCRQCARLAPFAAICDCDQHTATNGRSELGAELRSHSPAARRVSQARSPSLAPAGSELTARAALRPAAS